MEILSKTTATIQATCNGQSYELDVTAWCEDYGPNHDLEYNFDIDAIWKGDDCAQGSDFYKEIYCELDAENVFNDAWNASRQAQINLHKSVFLNQK